jgi:hypothetical protein
MSGKLIFDLIKYSREMKGAHFMLHEEENLGSGVSHYPAA